MGIKPVYNAALLQSCARFLLRPIAAFAVRHGLKMQPLIECLKIELIAAAQRQLSDKALKINTSRMSAVTGLQRKDIERLLRAAPPPQSTAHDLITKVVGLWRTDARFCSAPDMPRTLTFGPPESEFSQLISQVSRDLTPGTVLFELRRIEAVQCEGNAISLKVRSYVPRDDIDRSFEILSLDADDLAYAVEDNVFEQRSPANLHARTFYDRIREDAVPAIRAWLLKEGHVFHTRVREFLSAFDQDVTPDPTYHGKLTQVSVGAFSCIRDAIINSGNAQKMPTRKKEGRS